MIPLPQKIAAHTIWRWHTGLPSCVALIAAIEIF